MIGDKYLEICRDLDFGTSGHKGDIIDLGTDELNFLDLYYIVLITETAVGGTSITPTLRTSPDETITGGDETIILPPPYLTADLTAGTYLFKGQLPIRDYQRYLGIFMSVAGTFTAGKITCGFYETASAQKHFPEGQN